MTKGVPPQPARIAAGLVPHMGVSWPRSGHHLLVRLLQAVLGEAFGYCQHYHTSAACCGRLPCTRPDIHLSKSHDFTGDLPRDPCRHHLVQWRDFLPSVVSDFELVVRGGGEDSRAAFLDHASHRFGAWAAFRARWVEWGEAQGQLVLRYEDLVADPGRALGRMLAALAPGMDVSPARIAAATARVDGERIERGCVERLTGAGVHAPRDVTAFRHYEPESFALLGRLRFAREEVSGAGRGADRREDVLEMLRRQAGEG